jgi:hypothetical protein
MRFRPVTWHATACDIWRPAVPRPDEKCEERVVFRGSQEIEIPRSFISVTRVL